MEGVGCAVVVLQCTSVQDTGYHQHQVLNGPWALMVKERAVRGC